MLKLITRKSKFFATLSFIIGAFYIIILINQVLTVMQNHL